MSVVYKVMVVAFDESEGTTEVLFEAGSPRADRLVNYAPGEVEAALMEAVYENVPQRLVRGVDPSGGVSPLVEPVEGEPEPVEPPKQQRRKRRTKAEIAADEAAARAAEAPVAEPEAEPVAESEQQVPAGAEVPVLAMPEPVVAAPPAAAPAATSAPAAPGGWNPFAK